MFVNDLFEESAVRANKDLKIQVIRGSNEGSYIELVKNGEMILSFRYPCYGPDSEKIRQLVKTMTIMLHIGRR